MQIVGFLLKTYLFAHSIHLHLDRNVSTVRNMLSEIIELWRYMSMVADITIAALT
jgi:hypothetical protein